MMTQRIMMQLGETARPLRLDSRGSGLPLLNSTTTGWSGLPLEMHQMGSFEGVGEAGPVDGEAGLLVILEGQVDCVLREKKREIRHQARAGSMSFLSGEDRRTLVRMRGRAEAVAIHLPEPWFHRLLLDGVPVGFGRTPPLAADETVTSLARTMCREVARGAPTGRLYSESLSVALLSYALDRITPSRLAVRGSLSDLQRRRLEKYIAECLHEDLTLSELAALVGLGARHFSTLFRRAFGTTPHRYVMKRRLAEGARRLAQDRCDIADIALGLGFCSQSHFAAAFRQAYGDTPRQYAIKNRPPAAAF